MKNKFRKVLVITTFSMLVLPIWGQDIIVTNKAQKIDAKILEVSTSEVRYKELDNLDGPIFILRTDEINSIIYANGKVVLYNGPSQEQKEAEAIAKANALGSLFGDTENITGSETKTTDQCGNPVGHGSLGGNSWSLQGRGIRGTMPMPSPNFKQEGKVVVQIRVNAAGNVVSATIVNGTTITDKQTQQLALDAAKKAKFTEGETEQIGTITYIFKLN